jgi:hypothetical protein
MFESVDRKCGCSHTEFWHEGEKGQGACIKCSCSCFQKDAWMPPSVPQPETNIDYEALPF